MASSDKDDDIIISSALLIASTLSIDKSYDNTNHQQHVNK